MSTSYDLEMTNFERVQEFHRVFDVEPVTTRAALWNTRLPLIEEELEELRAAIDKMDRVEMADALADLLYVVYGTAEVLGLPIDDVFAEVHRSNMTKLGTDGRPVVDENGKVRKGPRYVPPQIRAILLTHEAFVTRNDDDDHDPVNRPLHYRKHQSGVECIEITEWMNFNLGNVVKYIWRAGEKGALLEDLQKARWYLDREIARVARSPQ